MRFTFASLHTWEGCIGVASSLYDNDGYPKRSPMPTPQADACLSPCPVCVDSGWCLDLGGKPCCTAPEHHVPSEYATEAAMSCPARRINAHVALNPQTSKGSHGYALMDAESLAVMRWVKNTLISVAISECPEGVRKYARELVSGCVSATTMEDCEALGKEIYRRYVVRFNR